jgi:hypothetical protein
VTRDYVEARKRLGIVSGGPAAKALARVVRELMTADALPMPGDIETFLPRIVEGLAGRRVISAYARRAKNRRIWLWYIEHDELVELLLVTEVPPRAIDR